MSANRSDHRSIGTMYEEKAASYLEEHGFSVRERNFACRGGEIDLIAAEGDTLVFVEVKYRRTHAAGLPEESVTRSKQLRIMRAASYYIISKGVSADCSLRFDVIAIDGGRIRHYRDAFSF